MRRLPVRRPVVVLAERDKEDMDRQLRSAMRGYKIAWHTRMGAPHNLNDLHRVAAGQARTIILLEPENGEVGLHIHPCPSPGAQTRDRSAVQPARS
ncbi:hypothetical protein MMC07_006826 [Pseudocyphellaria aurata]|nr:hypothetical protein [Pseudocyphellaria aurata]